MFGGVCGGLGASLGVDPTWFRLAFVILALGGGMGLVAYVVAWILMPVETADNPATRHPHLPVSKASVIAGLLLVAAGIALLIDLAVPWFDEVLWPAAVIAVGVSLLYAGGRR